MAKTVDTVALQTGSVKPTSSNQTTSSKATSLIESIVAKPTLPTGTTISPQLQNVKTNELMATPGVTGTTAAATPTAVAAPTITGATAPTATTATGPAAQAAQTAGTTTVAGSTPTMTAAQGSLSTGAVAQAAQGAVTSDATVRGQLADLQSDVTTAVQSGNPLPVWARGAAKATEAAMANRGMSQSSMAAEALAEGIMNAAVPIATADAQTYKDMIFQNLANNQQAAITNAQSYVKMDMANLSNRQQANLQNIQARQSFLLSDQAAANAAAQFNATSQNQVNQFYDNMSATISQQNATRSDAMKQYATSEANKISALNAQNTVQVDEANAQRESTINQFNTTLDNQRQQFNVNNQREIDQSNVVWRRGINTANTAAVNAANQTNAQNLLNLSNWAMSAAWQQWRDEASWVNTSSENAQNRNHNLAMAALERSTAVDLQNSKSKDAMYQMIGKFGFDVIAGL
ncbi:hypothetical protein N9349_05275 [Candidatus Pelagibacter sp.]|nr:hypothetical protein [Candidatus Pelagibacter sp.]